MLGFLKHGKRAFVVYAAITFIVLLIITLLLVYQRYSITAAHERADLDDEMDDVTERFQAILQHNISSANTIALLYQHDKSLAWFDSSAAKLIALNEGVDLIQFHQGSVVKRIYPLKGNERALGVDITAYPQLRVEASLTTRAGAVQFAGPYDMFVRKDKAIAGRVPLFDNEKFVGRAVTVTSFSSIYKLIPEFRNQGRRFVFRLSKKNPLTGEMEDFFEGYKPKAGWVDSVFMPQGNWTLYTAYAAGYGNNMPVYLLALFGLLFSAMGATFVYHRTHQTIRLEQAIAKKTHDLGERMKELTTIYKTNEILKDELQSVDIAISRVVNILPPGWQYPEVCAARVTIGDRVYTTKNWADTAYKQQAPLQFTDGQSGQVEVVYLKGKPQEDEGPFLKEERNLINSIAETIELFYNKKFHRDRVIKSESSMHSLIHAIPVGMVLCDKNFDILIINSVASTRYVEMMGKTIEVGDNFVEALMPRDRDAVREVFAKVMKEKEPVEYEESYALPHGDMHINITVAPVLRNGESIGVCVAMHDISNRKQRDSEHNRIVEELQQHQATMEEFVRLAQQKVHRPLSEMPDLAARAKGEPDAQRRAGVLDEICQSANDAERIAQTIDAELNKSSTENR